MQTSNICVDIILPVYNVAPYIKECVDSILGQSHTNYRVILVDDGSSDNSAELCAEYAAKDSRFSFISQRNQGVVQARLTGLRAGQSEWVTFVDPDDYLSPNYLQALIEAQQMSAADFVVAQYYEVRTKGGTTSQSLVHRPTHGIFEGAALRRLYKTRILYTQGLRYTTVQLYPWAKLLRRTLAIEALEQTLGLTFGEDMVANLYMLRRVERLNIIETPIYYYRINREGAASKTLDVEKALKARQNTWERLATIDTEGDLQNQYPAFMWLSLRSFMTDVAKKMSFRDFKFHFLPLLRHHLYDQMVLKRHKAVAQTKADLIRLYLLRKQWLKTYYLLQRYLLK